MQDYVNLEIIKKRGSRINPDIHHSKVFSSEANTFVSNSANLQFFSTISTVLTFYLILDSSISVTLWDIRDKLILIQRTANSLIQGFATQTFLSQLFQNICWNKTNHNFFIIPIYFQGFGTPWISIYFAKFNLSFLSKKNYIFTEQAELTNLKKILKWIKIIVFRNASGWDENKLYNFLPNHFSQTQNLRRILSSALHYSKSMSPTKEWISEVYKNRQEHLSRDSLFHFLY